MIVECFGLPGSGKTTLCSELERYAPGRIVRLTLRGRVERALWLISGCMLHSRLALRLWRLIKAEPAPIRSYVRHLISVSFALTMKAHFAHWRRASSLLLIDEGMIQRLLSLTAQNRVDEYLILILPLVGSHGLVVIRGGSFERYEVADDRYCSPRFVQGKEAYDTWKRLAERNVRTAHDILRKYLRIIEVDNTARRDGAVLAAEIYRRLME